MALDNCDRGGVMSPERIAELRALCESYPEILKDALDAGNAFEDDDIIKRAIDVNKQSRSALPELLDEVERLRVELAVWDEKYPFGDPSDDPEDW